jgi:hypothetical protein
LCVCARVEKESKTINVSRNKNDFIRADLSMGIYSDDEKIALIIKIWMFEYANIQGIKISFKKRQ